ncbi:mucin-3A [Diprion similis]|uniref:mucin-3A n=1 Tax=Diprion similis TaxID=362088 RepID=UPI001EF988DC|nr:mucin-3A [Diprion similis]
MIIPLCLLVIIGLGHCQDGVPSRTQIEMSINRTIDEVERMIREDPRLPRLSRTEIVDILFNITSKDVIDSNADKESIDKARMEYQRALMVVLPYSPNASEENLKDLYTKPPMVQMISDTSDPVNYEMTYDDGGMEGEMIYSEKPEEPNFALDTSIDNHVALANPAEVKDEIEESTGSYENHRDTYSEVVDPIDFKTLSTVSNFRPIYDGKPRVVHAESPELFSFNLNNLQTTPRSSFDSTDSIVYSQAPEQFEDSLSTDSKLEIVYSTTVNTRKPPTTKFNNEVGQELSTESTTVSSTTTNRHVLASDQWHYNAPPATVDSVKKYPEYKFPTQTESSGSSIFEAFSTTTKNPEMTINIQGQNTEKKHDFKMEDLSSTFVTSMSTSTTGPVKTKFSSSYAANSAGVSKVSPTMPPMRSEIKDLLASIGLSESNPDQQPNVGSTVPFSGSNNLVPSQISGLEAPGTNSPSILNQNTFGSPSYDYKKGTQNLSPDMRLLLQTFGLQTSKNSETPSTTTKKPIPVVVNLNSYSNFKPLPTMNVKDQDMRDFLAKFGLGDGDSQKTRSHKSVKTRKSAEASPPSLIEAVPDNMRKILENIGLITRSEKSYQYNETVTSHSSGLPDTPKLHVFKPHETPGHTKEQKEKINKLLDTVRKVQSGSADSQEVQAAAKDLLETTKTLQNGPDPLSLEEILNIYNEGIKNEVKRQEDVTTPPNDSGADNATLLSTETTTPPSAETTSTTTAATLPDFSIASGTSNFADLADSFGGSTRAPDPVLPMQRKTGLYFLVDWNTFLEVGEEGSADKVNLRFQPKVGDRTRFLPVTVP